MRILNKESNPGIIAFSYIWGMLNQIFPYIENLFSNIFIYLPQVAVPFVIGIASYALLSILFIVIDLQNNYMKKAFGSNASRFLFIRNLIIKGTTKVLYAIAFLLTISYSIWRFGIIASLENKFDAPTLALVWINFIYLVFAIVLLIAFYLKMKGIQKFLLGLWWGILLLLIFIICPLTEGYEFTSDSASQLVMLVFVSFIPFTIKEHIISIRDVERKYEKKFVNEE